MVLLGRRGYFFVIDAIVAAAILLFGIIYLFGSSVETPDQSQTYRQTADFASIALGIPLSTSQNAYYRTQLLPANLVPFPDATPLEEMGYLFFENTTTCPSCPIHAQGFAQAIMDESLETRYGGAIYINGSLLYNRTVPQAVTVINRSVVLYVRMNATTLVGPLRGDILVWY